MTPRFARSIRFAFLALLLATPALAAAQATSRNIEDIIAIIIDLFTRAIPILYGVAILAFFWGVAMFIWSAGNEKKRSQGKLVMLWGVVALFVLFSVIGIITLLQYTFGIRGASLPIPSASPPSSTPAPYSIPQTPEQPLYTPLRDTHIPGTSPTLSP